MSGLHGQIDDLDPGYLDSGLYLLSGYPEGRALVVCHNTATQLVSYHQHYRCNKSGVVSIEHQTIHSG